jgi:hypothetical protein
MLKPAFETGFRSIRFLVRPSSPKIRNLLEKAVEFMTHTKDPSHGMEHIDNLLQETGRFFMSTGDTFNIDRDVYLLALYWHDVWKSQNKPNWGNYLFQQLYEGFGSMLMFKKQAIRVRLAPATIESVSYAIRKHSAFQVLSAKTLEAQLLWDIDTLDLWDPQRTLNAFRNLGRSNLRAFDSYIRYMKKAGFHLNFEWSRNEARKMRPSFFEEMSKFRESLVNGNKCK